MCFAAGGYYHKTQTFNQTVAQTSSSLMALACIGLIIPAAFNFSVEESAEKKEELLNLSHGTAIVLLIIYVLYLCFQVSTITYGTAFYSSHHMKHNFLGLLVANS